MLSTRQKCTKDAKKHRTSTLKEWGGVTQGQEKHAPGAQKTYPRGRKSLPLGYSKGGKGRAPGAKDNSPKGGKRNPPKEYPSLGKIPPYRGRGFAENLV
jgi:hypothetical protein